MREIKSIEVVGIDYRTDDDYLELRGDKLIVNDSNLLAMLKDYVLIKITEIEE